MRVIEHAEDITQELMSFISWLTQGIQYPDTILGWEGLPEKTYAQRNAELLIQIHNVAFKLQMKAEAELGYEVRDFDRFREVTA